MTLFDAPRLNAVIGTATARYVLGKLTPNFQDTALRVVRKSLLLDVTGACSTNDDVRATFRPSTGTVDVVETIHLAARIFIHPEIDLNLTILTLSFTVPHERPDGNV